MAGSRLALESLKAARGVDPVRSASLVTGILPSRVSSLWPRLGPVHNAGQAALKKNVLVWPGRVKAGGKPRRLDLMTAQAVNDTLK